MAGRVRGEVLHRFARIAAPLIVVLAMSFTFSAPSLAAPTVTDADDVEAFVDGLMAAHFKTHHLAGAVVAVVKDGEVLFTRGYGHADVDQRIPVDPETTLFRIGSTTKLFTWTAAMQLVEQGRLDLHADVNTYLADFQVPATYPEPITMAHLMNHTAGFEDRVVGLFAREPEALRPLEEALADDLPARVRPPGQISAYSNHGVALAGHVVSEVSGLSWEEYVERNILAPLGMERTTPRQPVPPELAPDLAVGYEYTVGRHRAHGFEYVSVGPAGSMSATASDMARFMIAHLQDGRLDAARILEPATAQQMHQRDFAHDPRVSGMAHGFLETHYNQRRLIGHGGDTFLFHTGMWLLPEENLGLFVSYNSPEGALARDELFEAFMDRYYPSAEPTLLQPAAGAEERVAQFSGSYRTTRLSYTTLGKVAGLLAVVGVAAESDGALLVQVPIPGQPPTRWVEESPGLFRQVNGDSALGPLVFRGEAGEPPSELLVGNVPIMTFERLAWYETPELNLGLVVVSMLLFVSAVILWPVLALRSRSTGRAGQRGTGPARLVAWAAGALYVGFGITFAIGLSDPFEIAFAVPPAVQVGLALGLGAAVLAVPVAVLAVLAWVRGFWGLRGRLHYTLVALAAVWMVWWLSYWNLLGFRY